MSASRRSRPTTSWLCFFLAASFSASLVLEKKQLVHSRAHQGSFADSRETVFEEQYEMQVHIIWRREGNPPLRIRHTLSLYGISGCIEQNGRDFLYAFP